MGATTSHPVAPNTALDKPVSNSTDVACAAPAPGGAPMGPDGKPKKICCSCPDTKRLRDTCIAERGPDHPYCVALIEAHKACLRVEGFKV